MKDMTNKNMIRILRGLLMNETENKVLQYVCKRSADKELLEC